MVRERAEASGRELKDGNLDDSTAWYENGEMLAKVNWKDGKKDGLETIWYDSGKKQGEGYWKDGKLQRVKKWKPNGEVCPITNVNYGNGISVIYNMDGSEKERFIFKDGEPIKTNEQSNEKTDAGISPEELDKLLENSIGESPPGWAYFLPPHEPPHPPVPLQRLPCIRGEMILMQPVLITRVVD